MNEYVFHERHMGTDVTLSFVSHSFDRARSFAYSTFQTIQAYEERFSRFLPDSELSVLNTRGTLQVSDEFVSVLRRSIALSTVTNEAFNPLVQVSRLGYRTTFDTVQHTIARTDSVPYDTDSVHIQIDTHTNTVTLAKGQQLDFGGMLKGYLAQKLCTEITKRNEDCIGAIINIGGDIATRGYDALHAPFMFRLYNPVMNTETNVVVTDASIATSGSYARRWRSDHGEKHHIVDSTKQDNPTSDAPVATSIIHDDGAVAEALATLFMVRGTEAALEIAPPATHAYTYFVIADDGAELHNIDNRTI